MVEKKRLLEDQKDIFQSIAEVGNAATHRAHTPSQETLVKILTAVETFLYQKFILPHEAADIKKETPNKDKPDPLVVFGLSEVTPPEEDEMS